MAHRRKTVYRLLRQNKGSSDDRRVHIVKTYKGKWVRTILAALMVIAPNFGPVDQSVIWVAKKVMPPCVYEDGSGGTTPCYWNGKVRGNKTGTSYIVWVQG